MKANTRYMKKSLLLFFVLFLTVYTTHAQWNLVINKPDRNIRQVVFPDDLHGYAIAYDMGGQSYIYRTSDGGASWDTLMFVINYVSYIHMTGPLKGYLFRPGSPNRIVHSTNGFNSFTGPAGVMDSCFSYFGMGMINDSTGYQLLNEGRLHKISYYGTAFSSVWDSITNYTFLDFPSNTTGYVAGGNKILKTTDAGLTWNTVTASLPFYAMDGKFSDVNTGYFVSFDGTYDRSLRKTTNGGISFSTVSNFKIKNLAVRGNNCLLVDSAGNVAISNNAGLSWTNEVTGIVGVGSDDYSLAITPSGKAFLANSNGQLMQRNGLLAVTGPAEKENLPVLYPNPTTNLVNIQCPQDWTNNTGQLYNHLGECLMSFNFTGNTHILPLYEKPAGVYFIRINNQNGTTTSRLVKQ
jgi:photosystem II stability/assembly factor-like uncharacterized protein